MSRRMQETEDIAAGAAKEQEVGALELEVSVEEEWVQKFSRRPKSLKLKE
jgi:hypothetical protein